MPTYIALIDFTEQGIRAVQESPGREHAFLDKAASLGATVVNAYWTTGAHDGVIIVDAPDDKVAASLFLGLGKSGNVRTSTLRAYSRSEFEQITAELD